MAEYLQYPTDLFIEALSDFAYLKSAFIMEPISSLGRVGWREMIDDYISKFIYEFNMCRERALQTVFRRKKPFSSFLEKTSGAFEDKYRQ
jgi:hypothetical protein